MLPKRILSLITAIAVAVSTGQAFAGANANAVLSLDLIPGGGAGNQTDDGVTSGTVSGQGTTIAVEVFATGVRTSLAGMILKFDFDASLLSYEDAENSAFSLSLPEGSIGTHLAAQSPVRLASSGFLARAEFTTVADATGREFAVGIESVTLAESPTSSDELRTSSEVTFNSAPSPDFDGDNHVGFSDFLIFASVFGSRQGDGRYNAAQDLNSDGSVDFADFLIFAQSFGGPPPSTGGGGAGNPDLVVQSPSVSNNRVSAGATFTLGATVRNQGNGSSAATTLHYYRSSDATVSTSDTQVGTDAVSGLSAGDSSAESINLTAPSSSGTYYYGACVDAVSGESNTGNNCSPAVTLTVATAPPPTPGASKLYWTDWGTDKIQRANLDGSGVEDLVSGAGLDGPDGLTLDMAGGKMYWTDAGTNKIQRADLNGSNVEDLVTGLGIPYGLALDVSGGKMYWTNRQTNKIQRADLSGGNVEDLITSGLTFPGGLALDVSGGKMYWTNPGANKIQRANLNGSGLEDLVTSGVSSPTGIAVDMSGGKMYWTDRRSDKIQRANLDGSVVQDLVTSGLDRPNGLALDVSGGKMYWTDAGTNKVQRANLDGSNVEDLVTGANGLVDPSGVALATASSGGGGGGGGGAADLVVVSPFVSNSSPAAGASFRLDASVRNQGDQMSAATTLRYHLSSDANISTTDVEVGTDAVNGLPASGGNPGSIDQALSIDLTAPSSAGTYYYGACVDTVSGESDTGNNCSAAVSISVATVTPPATGTSKLYWSDWGTDKIQRADLDGSNVEDLVSGAGLNGPDGLALDMAGGKMYWTDAGTAKIQRADLDGSNVEDLVTSGLSVPYGLALDLSGGKLYWTDRQNGKIQRADVDGSNVEDLLTLAGLAFPGEIALDVANGKMYWTNPGSDKIQRADLDGANLEDLVTSGLSSPTGLALDLSGGKMYWTDRGTRKIQRAGLDGSSVEDLVATGLMSPNGLDLDVSGGKMYWTDVDADKVQRADLDGSNVEDLLTSADGLVDPSGIAVGAASSSGGTYGVGDALPNFPTGFFVPRLIQNATLTISGGRAVIGFQNGGLIELQDGTRYTCVAAGGCGIEGGRVTRGTFE
ncbi:MAG: hypothetical protein J4F39_03385 [Candidatus Latescibacteria bacterium]|nr:hypothetical protein [Candidatus Latescibacterota bacterium]